MGADAGPSTSRARPAIASSASPTPVRAAREWAEQALAVPTFRDLARALAAVEPDVVVLASPPSTHRPLAELSLAAGCHVVVEKPLALTLPDAVAIADCLRASAGRIAMVAQNYRFRRQPRALHDLVAARALGRLLGIRISCRRDLRDAWISRRDWRGKMPYPYLLDMAIHHVDLVRMITGQEVAEVDARGWNVPDAPFKHDPTVAALLTLADGTPIAYEGTWAEPLSETSWNGDWELLGERGRATWSGGVDDALLGVVRFGRHRERAARVKLPSLRWVDRRGVLAELRRAVAAGEQPESLSGRQRQEPRHDFRDRPLDRRAPAGARRGAARGVKIGLFLALFSDRSLEEALDAALAAGCETVEIMSGPGARTAGRPSCSRTRRHASTSQRSSPSVGSRSRRSRATRTRCTPMRPSRPAPTRPTATPFGSRPSSASPP